MVPIQCWVMFSELTFLLVSMKRTIILSVANLYYNIEVIRGLGDEIFENLICLKIVLHYIIL